MVPELAMDMRMRENDVTLGIPKTSYVIISSLTVTYKLLIN